MQLEILGILMGAACGAMVGTEREWSGHASGPHPHFAGIRTATLLGGLAAVSGTLWMHHTEAIAIILLTGIVALVVAAYVAVSRQDLDATTEVAALVVIAAGWLAGNGSWGLASGIAVVTTVLLMEKSSLHGWVARIPGTGLRASFRFALMAVVILPLLPAGPYGPLGGIRPQELWTLVLLFSGISFAAYLVRSLVGPTSGYMWAGILGGLISSTNVTLSFARLSRTDRDSGQSLALGAIAACTMLNFRVFAATSMLSPLLGMEMLRIVLLPALVGIALLWLGLKKSVAHTETPPDHTSPLQFRTALEMALLLQAVLFLTVFVRTHWGSAGLLVSGAFLGFTDVDALVASMAKISTDGGQLQISAKAIGIGILSNTVLKIGIVAVLGQGRFRKAALTGLLLLGTATFIPVVFLAGLDP